MSTTIPTRPTGVDVTPAVPVRDERTVHEILPDGTTFTGAAWVAERLRAMCPARPASRPDAPRYRLRVVPVTQAEQWRYDGCCDDMGTPECPHYQASPAEIVRNSPVNAAVTR